MQSEYKVYQVYNIYDSPSTQLVKHGCPLHGLNNTQNFILNLAFLYRRPFAVVLEVLDERHSTQRRTRPQERYTSLNKIKITFKQRENFNPSLEPQAPTALTKLGWEICPLQPKLCGMGICNGASLEVPHLFMLISYLTHSGQMKSLQLGYLSRKKYAESGHTVALNSHSTHTKYMTARIVENNVIICIINLFHYPKQRFYFCVATLLHKNIRMVYKRTVSYAMHKNSSNKQQTKNTASPDMPQLIII